jgi:hypothetical protein
MTNSILDSTKKNLGIASDYTAFDADIIMHINSVFSTLNQLGIGPVDGFDIEDADAEWGDFIAADKRLNSVKTYMTLRCRLFFDPPTTSYHITAIQEEIKEFEWRLSTYREAAGWSSPTPDPHEDDDELVIDGGVIG